MEWPVSWTVRAGLVGHEAGFTYGIYSPQGLNLACLKELVELVRYPKAITPSRS
jgi:hypothetical protein